MVQSRWTWLQLEELMGAENRYNQIRQISSFGVSIYFINHIFFLIDINDASRLLGQRSRGDQYRRCFVGCGRLPQSRATNGLTPEFHGEALGGTGHRFPFIKSCELCRSLLEVISNLGEPLRTVPCDAASHGVLKALIWILEAQTKILQNGPGTSYDRGHKNGGESTLTCRSWTNSPPPDEK